MRDYKLDNDVIASARKLWMGIDAHKRTLHVTVIDEDGELVLSESVPHAKEHVVGLVRRLEDAEIVAVYEAGPTGYKLQAFEMARRARL